MPVHACSDLRSGYNVEVASDTAVDLDCMRACAPLDSVTKLDRPVGHTLPVSNKKRIVERVLSSVYPLGHSGLPSPTSSLQLVHE